MNKHNETNAGFSWRTVDRAKKHGNWLRDLVIALAIALAVSIVGMIGDAYRAEQIDPDQRQQSHCHGDRADR